MTFPVGMKLCSMLLVMLQCAIAAGSGAYSVNYYAQDGHPGVVNGNFIVHSAPSALHIADIYTRLSGLQPILHEESVGLPAIDVFTARSKQPMLLEVFGDELPKNVKPVLSTNAHGPPDRGPEMKAVLEELKTHGISAEGRSYKSTDEQSLHKWIEGHAADRPVIILHHAHTASAASSATKRKSAGAAGRNGGDTQQRILSETSDVPELTEFQISQYQICLWTGLAFVLLVAVSVGTISNMEVIPDSLLYAKFQSGRTGRSD